MQNGRTTGSGGPHGPSSSSLDPSETSDWDIGPQTRAQHRIHSRHWHIRARIIRAFWSDETGGLQKRADKLADCCVSPILWHAAGSAPRLQMQACKDRLCPRCQHERGRRARVKVLSVIRDFDSPRLITLTLRSSDEPLAELYARLFDSWRVLKQSPWWRSRVRAGVYAVEVTVNHSTGSWHPHLHLIYDGEYIEQRELSRIWKQITLDSPIVDIRAVHSRVAAAKYVADYIAKPADLGDWTDDQIREYAQAMRGKRLVHTFGKAHGRKIDEPEADTPTPPHVWIGPMAHARAIIERGGEDAAWVMAYLARMGPGWQDATGIERLPKPTNPEPISPADHDHFAALILAEQDPGQHAKHAGSRESTPPTAYDPPLFEPRQY